MITFQDNKERTWMIPIASILYCRLTPINDEFEFAVYFTDENSPLTPTLTATQIDQIHHHTEEGHVIKMILANKEMSNEDLPF